MKKDQWNEAKLAVTQSSPESSIYIGTDSQKSKKGPKWYRYSTVVIIHHNSNNGGKLFHNTEVLADYGNLRQRLITEVGMAVMTGLEIQPLIGDRHFELHLDLNADPIHKSNVAVKEALGYVMGTLGIEAKIKPDGWAAAHAADHAVRHM